MIHDLKEFSAFCRSLGDFWPTLLDEHLLTPLNNKAWLALMNERLKDRYLASAASKSVENLNFHTLYAATINHFTGSADQLKEESFFSFRVESDPDFPHTAAELLCVTFVNWLEARLVCTEPGEFAQLARYTRLLLKLGDDIHDLERNLRLNQAPREADIADTWLQWRELQLLETWFKNHLVLDTPPVFQKITDTSVMTLAEMSPFLAERLPYMATRIAEAQTAPTT